MAADPHVMVASVTAEPVTVEALAALVATPEAGAVVSFAGVVRDHDGGRRVTRLSYSAHPDACGVLEELADRIAGENPGTRIAVAHRVGELAVGDVALACAVSAPHRGEAFRVCSLLVDEVKRLIPVWKEQHFADGTTEWVGSA